MPSGEGRGRTSAMQQKRLIDRDPNHCMVPKIEIPEFMCYFHLLTFKILYTLWCCFRVKHMLCFLINPQIPLHLPY